MGDRANIYIHHGKRKGIYFYTHWSGTDLPETLQNALKRKLRWEDEAYLNRIIFSEMIKDSIEEETGYGISLQKQDGNDRILNVDTEKKTVSIGKKRIWTFEKFISEDINKISW